MEFIIHVRCEKGHQATITTEGMDRQAVVEWAKLMDGTSDFYVVKPRDVPLPGPGIAKCGECGSWFTCTVEDGE